jgi:hypothetical protein
MFNKTDLISFDINLLGNIRKEMRYFNTLYDIIKKDIVDNIGSFEHLENNDEFTHYIANIQSLLSDLLIENPDLIESFCDFNDFSLNDMEDLEPIENDVPEFITRVIFHNCFEIVSVDDERFDFDPDNIFEDDDSDGSEEINPDFYMTASSQYIIANSNHPDDWAKTIDLLEQLYQRNDLFITIMSTLTEYAATFSNDNKHYMLSFINNQIKNAQLKGVYDDLGFSIVIRQFTKIKKSQGIPEKRVGMALLKKSHIHPLSKEDALSAMTQDPFTGQNQPKEEGVNCKSFQDMLKFLNIDIVL